MVNIRLIITRNHVQTDHTAVTDRSCIQHANLASSDLWSHLFCKQSGCEGKCLLPSHLHHIRLRGEDDRENEDPTEPMRQEFTLDGAITAKGTLLPRWWNTWGTHTWNLPKDPYIAPVMSPCLWKLGFWRCTHGALLQPGNSRTDTLSPRSW